MSTDPDSNGKNRCADLAGHAYVSSPAAAQFTAIARRSFLTVIPVGSGIGLESLMDAYLGGEEIDQPVLIEDDPSPGTDSAG